MVLRRHMNVDLVANVLYKKHDYILFMVKIKNLGHMLHTPAAPRCWERGQRRNSPTAGPEREKGAECEVWGVHQADRIEADLHMQHSHLHER